MALNKREYHILILTVALAGGAALWHFGLAPIVADYQDLNDRLETEEIEYRRNRDTLSRTRQIEEDYRRVEATFPQQNDDRYPDDAFSEDVDAAVENILSGQRRVVEPVKASEIKGVTGYEFLTLALSTSGELSKVSTLLKGFDQRGFLVKNLALAHSRALDDPELKLDVTLARVVKIEDEESATPTGRTAPGVRR